MITDLCSFEPTHEQTKELFEYVRSKRMDRAILFEFVEGLLDPFRIKPRHAVRLDPFRTLQDADAFTTFIVENLYGISADREDPWEKALSKLLQHIWSPLDIPTTACETLPMEQILDIVREEIADWMVHGTLFDRVLFVRIQWYAIQNSEDEEMSIPLICAMTEDAPHRDGEHFPISTLEGWFLSAIDFLLTCRDRWETQRLAS